VHEGAWRTFATLFFTFGVDFLVTFFFPTKTRRWSQEYLFSFRAHILLVFGADICLSACLNLPSYVFFFPRIFTLGALLSPHPPSASWNPPQSLPLNLAPEPVQATILSVISPFSARLSQNPGPLFRTGHQVSPFFPSQQHLT